MRPLEIQGALLHVIGAEATTWPVRVVNLSVGGANVRIEQAQMPGNKIILELPTHALHLEGVVIRMRGSDAAIAFDAASSSDPRLGRVLRTTSRDPVRA